jgi:L-Lysine epsilon oxidase N-terminal
VIAGGTNSVAGRDASSPTFKGTYKTKASDGSPFQVDVELGQLRTDSKGRLIVLGGNGFSSAPAGSPLGVPPNTYYRNPNWHDDVADGPVTAEVKLNSTDPLVKAENGAWVIVAPPDYAPEINGVVTLYDVLLQLGVDSFGLPKPGRPSFDLDIAPILSRVRRFAVGSPERKLVRWSLRKPKSSQSCRGRQGTAGAGHEPRTIGGKDPARAHRSFRTALSV